MSIAILTQVYDEMRRLSIAGSVVASGDFRLKKLVPPLEQAGAKAPVFAKVADAVKAVVDGNEKSSPQALLELTTLVNAILYTQGETGAAGPLEPIETTDLGAPTLQTSARVLKPLLEALTTTGSGRLELIRDAHERGSFRDLRLVKPALEAIDDVYGEIGDFIAEKILPLYGKAILPELRAKFDMKGRGGHPRRLQLMHSLDAGGTRDLVKQALDAGSKEVKVIAIECLGAEPDDLAYLIEQSAAKAQEVRQAAYRALAGIDDDAAIEVLRKAMSAKEFHLAADSLQKSRNPKLLGYIIAEAEGELAGLRKTKDKKQVVSLMLVRLSQLLHCLQGRRDQESEAFVLKVFTQHNDLAKITGGPDLNAEVARIMQCGTKKLQMTLVDAHASLTGADLVPCFRAARRILPAEKVYEIFSPYVTAKVDEKKKQRDPAWAKREAIFSALGYFDHQYRYYYPQIDDDEDDDESDRDSKLPPLDPRWLDIAVQTENLGLVQRLIRPGHAAANAFLTESFGEVLKKAKHVHDCQQVVATMIGAAHPDATDAYVAVVEKFGKKSDYYFGYWFGGLIVNLPKSALPRLEALIPNLSDKVADSMLGYLHQLREKKD